MNKIKNVLTTTCIMVALLVAKNPISLKLMDVTDFVGLQSGLNVSHIIDLLNQVYYL